MTYVLDLTIAPAVFRSELQCSDNSAFVTVHLFCRFLALGKGDLTASGSRNRHYMVRADKSPLLLYSGNNSPELG